MISKRKSIEMMKPVLEGMREVSRDVHDAEDLQWIYSLRGYFVQQVENVTGNETVICVNFT